MNKVLAAVVHWGDPSITNRAVRCLLAQKDVDLTAVVWDNGPFSKSAALSNDVTVLSAGENLYWTPAVNAAIDRALTDQDYILFMNNDIFLKPQSIQQMCDIFTPEIGLVAPVGSALGGMQDHVVQKNRGVYSVDAPSTRVAAVVGACVMVRRDVWEEVGPLDESMPLGADDHDYCIRVKDAGYQIHVNHNDPIAHVGHASGASPDWNPLGAKSWDVFNKKWDGYFATEEEAIKCHWGYEYHEGWDVGTGWLK